MVLTGGNRNTRTTACPRATLYTTIENWHSCESCINIHFIRQREQTCLHYKDQSVMMVREISIVNCENCTKQINTLHEQSAEFLRFTAGGTYIYHWALNRTVQVTTHYK